MSACIELILIRGSLLEKSSPIKILYLTFILFLPAKEIALPDEVQKSLLSQSCDAQEVVLQLQVKQASLEQPDCETKALIRCLARKCKDSDRHDVFQHLREITPAGTTGEFLIGEVSCWQFSFHIFTYYLGLISKGSPRLKITFVNFEKSGKFVQSNT